MKLRRWLLTTLVVGLFGCGTGEDDGGSIGGGDDPATPGTNGTGTGGSSGSTTGWIPPPTTGGTTGGGVPGTTTGGASGGTNEVCQEQMVSSQRITPHMLIVLDKSGSMGPMGNDAGIDRWGGSVEALKAITADLSADIDFGLMTYPTAGGSCGAGQVDVKIAENNAAAIATALDGMQPNGGTPTAGTLAVAKDLFNQPIGVDDVNAPEYVLLVTDGSPNCYCPPNDPICQLTGGGGANTSPEAVQASVDEIKAMAAIDAKTYVIGFQTAQDATLSAALDQMAVAGGTGDTKHRPVEDKDSLVKAFRDIAAKAVSCTFVLMEKPPKPDYVQVTVDGVQINLNDANGWVLSPDGLQITLQGSACQNIQGDGQHTVNVKVKCEVVPPV